MNRHRLATCLVLLLSGVAIAAEPPQLVNAKVVTASAAGGLQNEVSRILKQTGPAWIGYAAPVVPGEHHMCCSGWYTDGGSGCAGCALEKKDGETFIGSQSGTAKLEPASEFFVFLRAGQGHIEKVRTFSAGCTIDAGGMTVYWLNDVRPSDSVGFLSSLAMAPEPTAKRLQEGAITAIAFHADASADAALDQFASVNQPANLRKKAAFWLGVLRGAHGVETLLKLMHTDPNAQMRAELTFPISQSKQPHAEEQLIRIAREDSSSHVRGQALFWLAQKAGAKVQAALANAVEDDPDTEVKKRAVFAISQMPPDQGVPLLIQLAKTNRNAAVRKQAIFWLGQSQDPRALDFIAEVLAK